MKLVFTSPDVISTSPKNFLTSRIDFTLLLLFEFLKKHHLPVGQVKHRIHQPDSKILQPQAFGHYFLCTLPGRGVPNCLWEGSQLKQVRADHLQELQLNRSSYIHTTIIMETSVMGCYIGLIKAILLGICFRHCHEVHVNFVNERNMIPQCKACQWRGFFEGRSQAYRLLVAHLMVPLPWGGGGGALLGGTWLIFAGDMPQASKRPYPIIVYSVANYQPHLSHFWANM